MPREVDSDERRQRIAAAALAAVAEGGFEAATMRAIAARAGCTTGMVTHHFSSRAEIMVTALRAVHEQAARRMAACASNPDPTSALVAVVHEALPLDDARRREWRVWLAFWGAAAVDEALRVEHERRYGEWRRLLDRLVHGARPGATAPQRRVAVDLLAGAVDGLGLQASLEPARFRPGRLEALAAAQVAAALAGLPEPQVAP